MNIPLRLLIEAQQHVVTVELTTGETYRGTLTRSEDTMNIQLSDVVVTARNGQVSHMDLVYVRGSHIRMVIMPDILKYAPVFMPKTVQKAREEAAAQRAQRPNRPARNQRQ